MNWDLFLTLGIINLIGVGLMLALILIPKRK